MSSYPPGVSGNEPHMTGDYPCSSCGGTGGDRDEDGFNACFMCGGSCIHPEEAPACPECGSLATEWYADLDATHQADVDAEHTVASYDDRNVFYCADCHEVTR